MGKLIGYARVSTRQQDADRQVHDLLAAGVRRGGLLIALVALPLYTPLMIFGASTLNLAAQGGEWGPPLMLTAAATLFAAVISPIASAMALRAAID